MKGLVIKKWLAISFIAGMVAGALGLHYSYHWLFHRNDTKAIDSLRSNRDSKSEFSFINPLLICDSGRTEFRRLAPFKEELQNEIDSIRAKGLAEEVGVYYRDINSGYWLGISEEESFYPASLSKVPLMMGVLKLAETDPGLLQREARYNGPMDRGQTFPPGVGLQSGKKYTVMAVLVDLIENSDNRAVWMLNELFDEKKLLEPVFHELGIPPYRNGEIKINLKEYAMFFRVLFNATYLNREMSELALELLSQPEMKEAIVAGLPSNVPSVHKFGILNTDPQHAQLHDCGIVYYPRNPYLLCVMTKGPDHDKLTESIREVSAFVYKNVDSQQSLNFLQAENR